MNIVKYGPDGPPGSPDDWPKTNRCVCRITFSYEREDVLVAEEYGGDDDYIGLYLYAVCPKCGQRCKLAEKALPKELVQELKGKFEEDQKRSGRYRLLHGGPKVWRKELADKWSTFGPDSIDKWYMLSHLLCMTDEKVMCQRCLVFADLPPDLQTKLAGWIAKRQGLWPFLWPPQSRED